MPKIGNVHVSLPSPMVGVVDETRVEIPIQDMIHEFDKGRFQMIKSSMEKEVGVPLNMR